MRPTIINQEKIEYQFDSFCKTVLRNEARDMRSEEKRWNEKFVSLDELAEEQMSALCACDHYELETFIFHTHGHIISVEDAEIAGAVAKLPERQRDAILLSYFLDLKDVEVAELMDIKGSTLHYHKAKAFEALRKFMEEARNA